MAKRKAGDFNTARAHVGAPHNQEVNVNARKNLTKRKSGGTVTLHGLLDKPTNPLTSP